MQLEEGCQKIIQVVKESENDGGITKNEVCRKLIEKYGGSRSTYWKCFEYLLGLSSEIEARIVPPNKQRELLFPTDKNRKVDGLRYKIKTAEKLIDLVEQTPLFGDCYKNPKKSKDLDPSNHIEVERIRKFTKKEIEIYTLQARHDLLEKISTFLIHYINDKTNEFSEDAEKECKEIMTPLIIRTITILQKDYSESVYCSNQFLDNVEFTTHIFSGKIDAESDIDAEFLKVLGRYYYLISEKFSNRFKIDSSKEQKIISDFTKTFYPKSQFKYDKNNKQISTEVLAAYFLVPISDDIVEQEERKILDKMMNGLAGRTVKKYILYGETDPIKIHEYYVKWFLSLHIFSNFEKKMVTLLTEWAKMDFEGYYDND